MLEKIGKYEVSEQIGVGGFGAVYRGRDPFIKRTVAIKTCQVNDDEIKHRFFREAELAGNLHHRHITTIYDFGVENGIPYIVQEFLTGEDLDKKIKRGDPIPMTRKIEILMAIADGLAYAHNASIVHRDVKPANVRVLEDGTVKVMDFGIAKSLQSESNLTQTGITLGTSAYLAPEQIRGEPIDRRTDIFALGVLAYELLTYRKPFRGEHLSTVLYKILNDTPEPIGTLVQDAPPALIAAVGRAMAKSADDRYPTMDAFRKDLQGVHRELSGLSGTYPAFTGDTVRTLRPDEDLETTLATPSSGVAAIRSNITPPSGALARVPAPSDATPTSASISGARPPLELVNFRDPTSDPANEDTVRRTTGSPKVAAAPAAAAKSRSATVVAILAVLVAAIAAYLYVSGRSAPAPAVAAAPTPAARAARSRSRTRVPGAEAGNRRDPGTPPRTRRPRPRRRVAAAPPDSDGSSPGRGHTCPARRARELQGAVLVDSGGDALRRRKEDRPLDPGPDAFARRGRAHASASRPPTFPLTRRNSGSARSRRTGCTTSSPSRCSSSRPRDGPAPESSWTASTAGLCRMRLASSFLPAPTT